MGILSSDSRTAYALYLINSYPFNLSSLKGVSLSSSSALKLYKIYLNIRSESLKRGNFDIRQRKFKNNTGVYLQNFLPYYAKFHFLNHMQFDSPMTKAYCPISNIPVFLMGDKKYPTVSIIPAKLRRYPRC